MLGVLLMLALLPSAASAPPDSAQFSGRVARLQQQVAELQQQLQRLQEHADPQRLPQRVIALEDELAKLQREVAQLVQLEDKLRRDLPWELLDRLTLFGSALAVVLTVVLTLVGYLVTKQFIYQYLKDNALTEKVMQQALPQIIQDAGPDGFGVREWGRKSHDTIRRHHDSAPCCD